MKSFSIYMLMVLVGIVGLENFLKGLATQDFFTFGAGICNWWMIYMAYDELKVLKSGKANG